MSVDISHTLYKQALRIQEQTELAIAQRELEASKSQQGKVADRGNNSRRPRSLNELGNKYAKQQNNKKRETKNNIPSYAEFDDLMDDLI